MRSIRTLLCLTIFCVPSTTSAMLRGSTFLQPRPQGVNMARQESGTFLLTQRPDNHGWYGYLSVTPEYVASFRSERIAEYFFATNKLNITGSLVEDRQQTDILADYFGLSPSFASVATLIPQQQQFIADFALYTEWNNLLFTLHAPLAWVQTEICICENIFNNGSDTLYPPFYMSTGPIAAPFASFGQAMRQGAAFGDVIARTAGNMTGPQSVVKLADIQIMAAYKFINHQTSHLDFGFTINIPTGNRPMSVVMFEPIAGNGRHWQCGLRMDAHVLAWQKDGNQEVNFVVDMALDHFFTARQRRSFDFKDLQEIPLGFTSRVGTGFGSRYILMKEFNEQGDYTGVTLPVINKTTLWCDVKIALQWELLFMLAYHYNDFTLDIGYNGWVRTHEQVSCLEKFPDRTYAYKGIQNTDTAFGNSNATQSQSTLHGDYFVDQAVVADPSPPVFLNGLNLNPCSAANPVSVTHKIFWNFGYIWDPRGDYHPAYFVGWGTEVEFEGIQPRTVSVNNPSISQWGMWLKGGIAY